MSSEVQASEVLSRDQLIHFFNRFAFVTSQPATKKRLKDAVRDGQEPVAVTTAIQEEIFLEMGIDQRLGIAFLGKIRSVYENDRDVMIKFYEFIAREELACDEAKLLPGQFADKMHAQQKLQEQQLEMLKFMRKFRQNDQSAILETLHQRMKDANFDDSAAVLTPEEIQDIVVRRISPFSSKPGFDISSYLMR